MYKKNTHRKGGQKHQPRMRNPLSLTISHVLHFLAGTSRFLSTSPEISLFYMTTTLPPDSQSRASAPFVHRFPPSVTFSRRTLIFAVSIPIRIDMFPCTTSSFVHTFFVDPLSPYLHHRCNRPPRTHIFLQCCALDLARALVRELTDMYLARSPLTRPSSRWRIAVQEFDPRSVE